MAVAALLLHPRDYILVMMMLLTWLHPLTTVIFGALKNDSLEINSLALNNCFS